MAQRPNIPKRQSGKPSKLLTACALVIAFSLPYLLVKNFSHHSSNDYTHQSLSLPKLAEGPSITQPNTDESEEELEEEAKVVKIMNGK